MTVLQGMIQCTFMLYRLPLSRSFVCGIPSVITTSNKSRPLYLSAPPANLSFISDLCIRHYQMDVIIMMLAKLFSYISTVFPILYETLETVQ